MLTWDFCNDECKRDKACNCGFCKRRDAHTGMQVDCDYGDCRRPVVARCPVFHYPVCERHRNVNRDRANGRITYPQYATSRA